MQYVCFAYYKVNVDEEMGMAVQLGPSGTPALAVVEKGEKVAQAIGHRPKADIFKILEV